MKEYTEIEIVNSLKDVDSVLEIKKYISFKFESDKLRRGFVGGSPSAKLDSKTIKFLTQGHHEGISLSEVKSGTDVRLIQELLGHSGIKTTLKYTHVS